MVTKKRQISANLPFSPGRYMILAAARVALSDATIFR